MTLSMCETDGGKLAQKGLEDKWGEIGGEVLEEARGGNDGKWSHS